jgi:hypothetical protein
MHDFFNASWEQLELEHVEALLATAGEESLTWEAKGEDPRPDGQGRLRSEQVRKEACAFANQIGGYVLVGVSGSAHQWSPSGIEIPGAEPGLWIDQVMEGLSPQPVYEKKYWQIAEGRTVAILRVEPISQTPCMTADGQVFERVSSESRKVIEPLRLAELISRGKKAQEQAEVAAGIAATELFEHPDVISERSVWVGFGLHSASYQPDISARLFHSRFPSFLAERFGERAITEPGLPAPPDMHRSIGQDRVEFLVGSESILWVVRAHWSGRVGVAIALARNAVSNLSLFDALVIPAWKLAADLSAHLGAYGDVRVHLAVKRQTLERARQRPIGTYMPGPIPPESTMFARLPPEVHLKRQWSPSLSGPSDEIVGSMQRELMRAAGNWIHEGEPDAIG